MFIQMELRNVAVFLPEDKESQPDMGHTLQLLEVSMFLCRRG